MGDDKAKEEPTCKGCKVEKLNYHFRNEDAVVRFIVERLCQDCQDKIN